MIQSLYSARTGVLAQQRRIDVIANNIANINTVAYKSSNATFKDAIYQELKNPGTGELGEVNLQRGHGVHVADTHKKFTQGSIEQTGMALDMAINGEGFFLVRDGDGEIRMTRDGAFYVSLENGVNRLVTAQGYYVLDDTGEPIELDSNYDAQYLKVRGHELYFQTDTEMTEPFATIAIISYENIDGLLDMGNNTYMPSEACRAPFMASGEIMQGALEMSNVDLAQEMTRLIRAQRAFTLVGKAITTADDMESVANGIRA